MKFFNALIYEVIKFRFKLIIDLHLILIHGHCQFLCQHQGNRSNFLKFSNFKIIHLLRRFFVVSGFFVVTLYDQSLEHNNTTGGIICRKYRNINPFRTYQNAKECSTGRRMRFYCPIWSHDILKTFSRSKNVRSFKKKKLPGLRKMTLECIHDAKENLLRTKTTCWILRERIKECL